MNLMKAALDIKYSQLRKPNKVSWWAWLWFNLRVLYWRVFVPTKYKRHLMIAELNNAYLLMWFRLQTPICEKPITDEDVERILCARSAKYN